MNESSTWSGRDGIGWVRSSGWGEKKTRAERARKEKERKQTQMSKSRRSVGSGQVEGTVGTGHSIGLLGHSWQVPGAVEACG
jgi:hypothetical protein